MIRGSRTLLYSIDLRARLKISRGMGVIDIRTAAITISTAQVMADMIFDGSGLERMLADPMSRIDP
jgi:hypothetical protein